MRAGLLHGFRDLRVEEIDPPTPGRGEALVRIAACGVCPSDLRGYLGSRVGTLPRRLGHEWSGVVEALGEPLDDSEQQITIGSRVVVDWRCVCGRCYECRRGVFGYCENLRRGTLGGFADYGTAPVSQLRVVPGSVPLEDASFCEPLACVLNAHSFTEIPVGADVVVVGLGPIGLLHLQLARGRGARVIGVDPLPSRRELALALGAHDVIDTAQESPVAEVQALTEGRGADAVLIAVGAVDAIRQGLEMAAINGWVNIFAGTHPPADVPVDPNLVHYRQLRVTGSHDYNPHHFSTALKLLQHKIVRVAPLVSHRFELAALSEAFETTANRRGMKSIVSPDGKVEEDQACSRAELG
ncbi:zinc-binding dehydrogenase [Actinopolymorpha pittospori]|uniref:zinc-binding dehydrogenase n=1 Tax=Actinopolymorpha pittospori TaxID=648752 RepID=UPI00178AEA7F